MKLRTLIFEVIPFFWRFNRVRNLAIEGKYRAARQKLAPIEAPEGYLCLKEAYDARLASITYAANVTFEPSENHSPDELGRLIFELQTHRWYCAPTTANERYAARYIDYLETLALGDADRRRELAKELDGVPADRFFKDELAVT
jgi:hypothetical protein